MSSAVFFPKSAFSKNSGRKILTVSNSLDPDQAWHIVRHDLGTNPLQMIKRTPKIGKNYQYALKGEHVHKKSVIRVDILVQI